MADERSGAETKLRLDELTDMGFPEGEFWRIHHFREKGVRARLGEFRLCCETTNAFRADGTNVRVRRRIDWLLKQAKQQPGKSSPFDWADLAEKAYREIPRR